MNGVKILNVMPSEGIIHSAIVIGILCLIASIITFIWTIIKLQDIESEDKIWMRFWIVSILLSYGGLNLLWNGLTHNQNERYEVTIDSNVSFDEFNSRYEIIEQRGEIYVVELKGDN